MTRIRKVEQPGRVLPEITRLDRAIFPGDEPVEHIGVQWWVAWDGRNPVGYMGLKHMPGNLIHVVRYGLLARACGQHLGRRFLQVAYRYARQRGANAVITYTLCSTVRSMNALMRAGFKTYQPKDPYIDADVVYWIRHT
jgi:GNAT superfamily N-acetyltransferase